MTKDTLKPSFQNIIYASSFIFVLYILVYFFIYRPLNAPYSSFRTLPLINKDKVSPGYTLLAPYNRMLNADPKWKGKIYLLDMFGRAVHTWKTNHQALNSHLMENGNLLAVMESPTYKEFYPPGGNTGRIQELDWNSKIVWEYVNERMHHDIYPMKNGNIVMALWEKTPPEIAQAVQGGVAGSEFKDVMWSDQVVELDRNKQVVWSWHSYEHMDPSRDVLGMAMPRFAWTYVNGISYMAHNPLDGEEGFLISMRSVDTVYMVRKRDGEIIWRSPAGMLNVQHDPTLTPEGNILVFDNGLTRKVNPFPIYGSRVVEINPKTDAIVWQFTGGEGAIDKVRFFAAIVGGAQRLPNGNTLITDGPQGHVFEVTKKKELVWDMVSPYLTRQTGPFPNNFLFKTRRYGLQQVKWPIPLPAALSDADFFLFNMLKNIYP